jgi:hypothetical protein
MHSFIVANLGNRTTITRDLRLEAAHFTRQSASPRINQRRLRGCSQNQTVENSITLKNSYFLHSNRSRAQPDIFYKLNGLHYFVNTLLAGIAFRSARAQMHGTRGRDVAILRPGRAPPQSRPCARNASRVPGFHTYAAALRSAHR